MTPDEARLKERAEVVRIIQRYRPAFIPTKHKSPADVFALQVIEMVKRNLVDQVTDDYVRTYRDRMRTRSKRVMGRRTLLPRGRSLEPTRGVSRA